jgi:hypothetical protein
MARAGIPIFVAPPDLQAATGFALPRGWQTTAPDPAVVDHWRPGMALCAVMGCGLDLIDVDPRSGGSIERLVSEIGGWDKMPRIYGTTRTPSGGTHYFIASMGVGSLDGIVQGVDIKGGMPDGSSRGFAFIPPTVRASKTTGQAAAYGWAE